MGTVTKSARRRPDRIAQLTAQVQALTARLAALEATPEPSENGNGHKAPQSRRDLLKLAGAASAGAAGSILLRTVPAAVTSGLPVVVGNSTTNDSATTTDLSPTTATAASPLFQATGQGVLSTTTVPATASTTPPLSQSVPLIGAIGAGGALPNIGTPPIPDYPGFAPIQGVGGVTSVAVSGGTVEYSEGVNGYGTGATGFGVTGESDVGYGVAGGSGGIDLAAIGHGRLLQAALLDSNGNTLPGPPTYLPNDFEQVRDVNGVLWLSKPDGSWRPVKSTVVTITPFRIYDSRPAKKAANSFTDIPVAGVGGIPTYAVGVFGNLTALGPAADGFLTMFPKGGTLNQVNSLNFLKGVVLSNHVMVGLGTGGAVTVFVSGNGATSFLFDVYGYIV